MKVLVIDDEVQLVQILKKGLALHHCVVDIATSGKEGVMRARSNHYDVIILDYCLGDMRGDEVATLIRTYKSTIPILVLSREESIQVKVSMLSVCDDYVTKPFSFSELVARLHALVRRGAVVQQDVLTAGPLVLDARRYTVSLYGRMVVFRNREFALLEYLMRNQGIVLSRETILTHVWDMNADPFTNTVDTHIRLLRKKLDTPGVVFIHTLPKRGYQFLLV